MFINKIILKNFRIFRGTHEFDFSNSKVIVIDGPNGHGKSTIFDAINWVLSGKITRYVGSSEYKQFNYIVNNYEYQSGNYDASVEIEFKNNGEIIKIKRRLKNNSAVKLYINGVLYGVKEGQQIITNLIANKKRGEIFTEQDIGNNLTDLPSFLSATTILSQENLEEFVRGNKPIERYLKLEKILGLTRYGNDFRDYLVEIKRQVDERYNQLKNNEEKLKHEKDILDAEYNQKILHNTRMGKVNKEDILRDLNLWLNNGKLNLNSFNTVFKTISEEEHNVIKTYKKELLDLINGLEEIKRTVEKNELKNSSVKLIEVFNDEMGKRISLLKNKRNNRSISLNKAKEQQRDLSQVVNRKKQLDLHRDRINNIKLELREISTTKNNILSNLGNYYPQIDLNDLEEFEVTYKGNISLLEQCEKRLNIINDEEKLNEFEIKRHTVSKYIENSIVKRDIDKQKIEELDNVIKGFANEQTERTESYISRMVNQIQEYMLDSNDKSCIVCGMNYFNEENLKSAIRDQLSISHSILSEIEKKIRRVELEKSKIVIKIEECDKEIEKNELEFKELSGKINSLKEKINKNIVLVNPEIVNLEKGLLIEKINKLKSFTEHYRLKYNSSKEHQVQQNKEQSLYKEKKFLEDEINTIIDRYIKYKDYFKDSLKIQRRQDRLNEYISAAELNTNELEKAIKLLELQIVEENRRHDLLIALASKLKDMLKMDFITVDGKVISEIVEENLKSLEIIKNKVDELIVAIASYLNETELLILGQKISEYNRELQVVKGAIQKHSAVYEQLDTFMGKHRQVQNKLLNQYLDELAGRISSFYRQISPHAYYKFIRLLVNKNELFILLSEEEIDFSEADEQVLKDNVNASLTFSAAQSTVLAMSIFLALNLSQNWSDLKILGIDDPFQNLDDINIYSFIDVISYLVAEEQKQIFISTHHQDFSKLIASKLDLRESEFSHITFQSYTKETIDVKSEQYKLLEGPVGL
ncbi:hypothetical protein CO726_28270 [Bacillus fungorum]|uniref:Nuclease SbcCD subunit C n=1 Tax=Bacillus fungorum TaxID=2039284 RepID=A0A2G6Q6R3_9BACI|nr:SMC family ATPase [Bacillus fungorum]PIE92119.1 hypothetical protein CO726_28270 [Bacillus fungorum]